MKNVIKPENFANYDAFQDAHLRAINNRSSMFLLEVANPEQLTEEEIELRKQLAEAAEEHYEDLRKHFIENKPIPGFVRQESNSESHDDGVIRVTKALEEAKRLAKKEGRDVNTDAKVKALTKELKVLKDEKNFAIYKPELKPRPYYEYKKVSKSWLDGSSRGKGKEGHRESLGTALVSESPIYKESFSEKTGQTTKSIVGYDITLLVNNGSLSTPNGIVSMVRSFMNTLVKKGVFKNNQMITRDQYGYTYLVQDLISDVSQDIAEHCGWVTTNSYKLMNKTFYQTIRAKQQSKKLFMKRQSWLGINNKYFLQIIKDEIGFAIDYIANGARCECPSFNPLEDPMVCKVADEMQRNGYSAKEIAIWIRDYQKKLESEWYADHPEVNFTNNWAKENPDYAEDVINCKKGYHKMVVKYFLAANNSEELKVHNFKAKFPEAELNKIGVDAEVLKDLASEVRDYLRIRFGVKANAFTNLNRMMDEIRARKDEHGFMLSFIQEEMSKNVGHNISFSLDGFREEDSDKLALVDNHGELVTTEEARENLPVALTMFDVSTSEIKDIELDEEVEKSLQ